LCDMMTVLSLLLVCMCCTGGDGTDGVVDGVVGCGVCFDIDGVDGCCVAWG